MRFYTPIECAEWSKQLQVALNDRQQPARDFAHRFRLRCSFPQAFSQLLWFSRCIESALHPRHTCLLWITDFGIYPSNENNHLYYRLRQSYGDFRLLHEAPGHLCLDYEQSEVVTLIHLCILFGWDIHLIPSVGHGQAFVCHDEWTEIGFSNKQQLDETRLAFEQAGLQVSMHQAE